MEILVGVVSTALAITSLLAGLTSMLTMFFYDRTLKWLGFALAFDGLFVFFYAVPAVSPSIDVGVAASGLGFGVFYLLIDRFIRALNLTHFPGSPANKSSNP